MSSSLDSILDTFCAQVYNATGNSRNLTYDSTNNETKIWGACKVEKITIPNNQFYIETTNTQTTETIDENTGEPTTQTITTTSSTSIYDVFAALNHTHSVINNNLTINGSANALYLYGNNMYSRFCVARNANTANPAVYGYDDILKCAYMKILGAATELLVYNNKVVVQSGDFFIGNTNIMTEINGKAESNHTHAISDITDLSATLSNLTPNEHRHKISDIYRIVKVLNEEEEEEEALETVLNNKANVNHTHSYSDLTNIPSTFTPSSHTHTVNNITDFEDEVESIINSEVMPTIGDLTSSIGDLGDSLSNYVLSTDLSTTLASYSQTSHTHSYNDLTNIPSTFTPSSHSHAISEITNLSTTLDGKASSSHTHSYNDLTNIPSTFTPSSHSHAISEITNLSTTLDGKASSSHTHSTINNQLTINTTNAYPLYIYGGSTYNRLTIGKDSNTSTTSIVGHAAESTPYTYIKLSAGSAEFHMLSNKAMIYNGGLDVQGSMNINGSIKIRSNDGYYLNDVNDSPYLYYNSTVSGLGISSGGINVPGNSVFSGSIKLTNRTANESNKIRFEAPRCSLEMWVCDDSYEAYSGADDEHVKLMMRSVDENGVSYYTWLTYSKDVGKGTIASKTITHTALMNNSTEFNNLQIGSPVYGDGNTYKMVNDEFIASTEEDYIDCIPGTSINGTYKTFLGICVKKHAIGERMVIGDSIKRYLTFTQNCIEFATHGDYLFKVADISIYSIGDTITYTGDIVDDDTPLTNRLTSSIIGKITRIFTDSHYVAVFKA